MKQTIAAAFLLVTSIVSSSEACGDTAGCSIESFAAYGQTWSGIPVLPNAILAQPSTDSSSCAYAVRGQIASVGEWYEQQLTAAGWRLVSREKLGEGTVLFFRREDEAIRVGLLPGNEVTKVLMKQLEPNNAMEPTR